MYVAEQEPQIRHRSRVLTGWLACEFVRAQWSWRSFRWGPCTIQGSAAVGGLIGLTRFGDLHCERSHTARVHRRTGLWRHAQRYPRRGWRSGRCAPTCPRRGVSSNESVAGFLINMPWDGECTQRRWKYKLHIDAFRADTEANPSRRPSAAHGPVAPYRQRGEDRNDDADPDQRVEPRVLQRPHGWLRRPGWHVPEQLSGGLRYR